MDGGNITFHYDIFKNGRAKCTWDFIKKLIIYLFIYLYYVTCHVHSYKLLCILISYAFFDELSREGV
jgi:hypothetical protein